VLHGAEHVPAAACPFASGGPKLLHYIQQWIVPMRSKPVPSIFADNGRGFYGGVGNLRKCGMRKVICGMNSAEVGCGTVGNMRNAE